MDFQTLLPILLSWAVHLSGYSAPEQAPTVEFKPHSFFVTEVCGGVECKAVGWYNDSDVVYIDERYRDSESNFANSLIVHELTHYLQHRSGNFDSHSCDDSLSREREAYTIQNDFLIKAYASFNLIKPGPTSCNYSKNALAAQDTQPASKF